MSELMNMNEYEQKYNEPYIMILLPINNMMVDQEH